MWYVTYVHYFHRYICIITSILSNNLINTSVPSNILEFRVSPLATIEHLQTTHCPSYIDRYLNGHMTPKEIRNIGFPWSQSHVKRSLSSVGGTVAAAIHVCQQKQSLQQQQQQQHSSSDYNDDSIPLFWSAHVAGGTHHAFYDYGEGFCIFSDIAVAANVILQKYPDIVKRILIIDLDVHQGNGNAVLFQGKDNVLTFSMHCQNNYFSPKQQSDLDIELPSDCNDITYLSTLHYWLNTKLQQTLMSNEDDHTNKHKVVDFLFFQSGVDILKEDRLGKMSLSQKGISKRNQMVYEFAKRNQLPLVITMGGGYPNHKDNWEPIIDAHSNVYIQAYEFLQQQQQQQQ